MKYVIKTNNIFIINQQKFIKTNHIKMYIIYVCINKHNQILYKSKAVNNICSTLYIFSKPRTKAELRQVSYNHTKKHFLTKFIVKNIFKKLLWITQLLLKRKKIKLYLKKQKLINNNNNNSNNNNNNNNNSNNNNNNN